ncbi:tubulin folding cofactor d [Moniliophthora roreri MCA 2997]|uniref:Tubulin folding cofactor d n=2 Tax=Moniliophthora roreri TaxID=221103 RepID=V2X755_MONRO|nr:tubulin folding cofactor d [Moniliophthora roreri MCA 2997]
MAQQGLGRLLGVIDYERFPSCLDTAIKTLLNAVDRSSGPFRSNVEARRNCYQAMAKLFQNVSPRLSSLMTPEIVNSLFDALQDGLRDYSVDERGDVGSWVRMACIRGLNTFVEILLVKADGLPNLEGYLPLEKYHRAIGGILKQGVERLDNVRLEAGRAFENLLRIECGSQKERWRPHEASFLTELLLQREDNLSGWNDASWLFPKGVQILRLEPYRKPVLLGLISSIGSLTDSTHRPASASLVSFVRSLPVQSAKPSNYDIVTFIKDLFEYAKSNITSNVVVIPVLQVFNILLEGDAFGTASNSDNVTELLRLFLFLVCKHVDRLKSVRRVHESLKVTVNLLIFSQLFGDCLTFIPQFLAHQYPTARSNAAEYLYLGLQRMDLGRDTDEAEEVILETEWSSLDSDGAREAADIVVKKLKNTSS